MLHERFGRYLSITEMESRAVKDIIAEIEKEQNANGIIKEKRRYQIQDVRMRSSSCLDNYTCTTKEQDMLTKNEFTTKMENSSMKDEQGCRNKHIPIMISGGCPTEENLTVDNVDEEKFHMRDCDESYDNSCLTPKHISSTGNLLNKINENKLKRNTIAFPASYDEEREQNLKSRSLPSLIESSIQKTHVKDITSTPLYKEIYTNNIRQYSFLLAKKLGTSNQSPQNLRKAYLENRKKAAARGVCSALQHSHVAARSPDHSIADRMNEKCEHESDSWSDTSSVDSEPVIQNRKLSSNPGKHKGSLTDISRILCQCDHKTITPELSNTTGPIEYSNKYNATTEKENISCASSCPDLLEKTCEHADSGSLDRRQNEANKRLKARVARLNSFDDMVKHANNFLKDLKSKKKFSKSTEVF